jgi:hypothetical protein
MTANPEGESPWRLSWRADPVTRAVADRHYNRQKPGAAQFVPPGRCLVLKTFDGSAVWVTSWPYPQFVAHAWPGAFVNSLFRNESGRGLMSSDLIRWAVAHTRARWPLVPDLGIVSFVDASKTAPKDVPGWCYRPPGWSHVGFTQAGLYAFQQLPGKRIGRRGEPMPDATPVPGWQPSLFDVEAG